MWTALNYLYIFNGETYIKSKIWLIQKYKQQESWPNKKSSQLTEYVQH